MNWGGAPSGTGAGAGRSGWLGTAGAVGAGAGSGAGGRGTLGGGGAAAAGEAGGGVADSGRSTMGSDTWRSVRGSESPWFATRTLNGAAAAHERMTSRAGRA